MNQVPSIHHPASQHPDPNVGVEQGEYGHTPARPVSRGNSLTRRAANLAARHRKGHVSPRITGIALITLSFLLMAALASWTIKDPSLSHATQEPVTNWLGKPGAIISDLLMQILGLGSLLFTLPLAIWGWMFIRRKKLTRFGVRFACWIGATLFASGVLACLAKPESWPLPSNLGGLTGDLFLKLAKLVLGANPSGSAAVLYGLILIIPTCILAGYALGVLGKEKHIAPALSDTINDHQSPQNHAVQVHYSESYQQQAAAAQAAQVSAHAAPVDQELPELYDDELEGLTSVARGAVAHWGLAVKATLSRLNFLRRSKPFFYPGAEHHYQAAPQSAPNPQAYAENTGRIEPTLQRDAHAYAQPAQAEAPQVNPQAEAQYYNDQAYAAQAAAPQPEFNDYQHAPNAGAHPLDEQSAIPAEFTEADIPASQITPEEAIRITPPAAKPKPAKRNVQEAQASLLNFDEFELPQLHLLAEPPASQVSAALSPQVLEQNARMLESVLDDFGVKGDINDVRPGPVVTLYELEPAPGIRSSRVIGLADDIARSMSARSARVSVVPGRNAIGIELPNENRETIYLREMLGSRDFEKNKSKLPVCLGKNIGGEPIIADLARMPHLLIAGTTGSGKSVGINTMILSLLYRHTPEECRLIMIDPKMLELSVYDGIPHLLTPVVTDPHKAVTALKWAVREMEDRYKKMSKVGVRNIDGFNARVKTAAEKGETITRTVQTGFDKETGEAIFESETFELEHLPFIVVIVDEMADLMMVAGKDIEGAIQRLAQMARAAGIHMVTATQRPSVDVITGTIKANFPTRISFQVTSKIDSRTILGEQGAEQLLGMGDMLYMAGGGRITRLHGPFVSDEEVEKVVQHLKSQGSPEYLESVTEDDSEDGPDGFDYNQSTTGDELYDKAVNIVLNDRKASTSYIQRRLSIGYNRAATLIEKMEEEGVISAANHAGKREILVGDEQTI